ncbi:hypothetical protein [Actinomycetospora soli]|uniref:hypothetical protein n=1 Tax=Actinomycetospora soli TaxID=2893887 RepID=UPI001E49A69B|nr:hypothetical protein [Actinomycetospora soli]MCD2188258.1 hypothetical protein [Actinomycetospora soli]
MIVESIFWRKDLFRIAAQIRHDATRDTWTEHATYKLERNLALGAFSSRRMLESGKTPASLSTPCIRMALNSEVNLRRFRFSFPIDILQAVEMYDFKKPTSTSLGLRTLVNQFVHSHTLVHLDRKSAETPEAAVLVCSESERKTSLYAVWLRDIAATFERVALTEPTSIRRAWNDKRSDFETTVTEVELDEDRLHHWGFAAKSEITEAVQRLQGPRKMPPLADELTRLAREIEEFEALSDEEQEDVIRKLHEG